MASGRVKWFNRAKGFGIIGQGDEREVFVHYSQIIQSGIRTLNAGDEVDFELRKSYGGLHAVNVRKRAAIDSDEKTPTIFDRR